MTVEYFDHLLEKIHEIRLSEHRFYQKITNIYVISLAYDQTAKTTRQFLAKVLNKMYYAVHGYTAALLSQRKLDGAIEIGIDLGEMDIISAETKATYREIHQYVQKETGLMVPREPQCPLEKEAAIMAALKPPPYFYLCWLFRLENSLLE